MLAFRSGRILARRARAPSPSLTWNVRTLSTAPANDGKPVSSSQEQIDKSKLERLSKEFMSLNLSETIAFIDMMQKLLGLGDVRAMVSAGAGTPAAGGAGGGKGADSAKKEAAPAAPVKSSFELKLDSFEAGDKIKVIKAVREITGLGLKEAKDMVEGAPKVLMKDIAKEQGEQLIEKLKAAGGKASLV
jgi:large subunit ribosomal protein L7/L12